MWGFSLKYIFFLWQNYRLLKNEVCVKVIEILQGSTSRVFGKIWYLFMCMVNNNNKKDLYGIAIYDL